MLNLFKQFDANRLDIDDLVALRAFGRQLAEEYTNQNVEVPEFVSVNNKALDREILARNRDRLEKRVRELKSRRDALKTPVERKREIDRELASLQKQLA